MTIIKQFDKRSGITYAYENYAYWDKEEKKRKSRRVLIGRVDDKTGEIVPTSGRNKKRSPSYTGPREMTKLELQKDREKLLARIEELEARVKELEANVLSQ